MCDPGKIGRWDLLPLSYERSKRISSIWSLQGGQVDYMDVYLILPCVERKVWDAGWCLRTLRRRSLIRGSALPKLGNKFPTQKPTQELIDKQKKIGHFNQGYSLTREILRSLHPECLLVDGSVIAIGSTLEYWHGNKGMQMPSWQ